MANIYLEMKISKFILKDPSEIRFSFIYYKFVSTSSGQIHSKVYFTL